MNLILLSRGEVAPSGEFSLDGPRANHLLNVLRAAEGSVVRVGILDGASGLATVTRIGAGAVGLRGTFDSAPPPPPRVDLLLALPRSKVLRRLWAQLAAVGVGRIVLTNAEKVERNYFDTHVLKPDCYRPLLVEGLQQVRDTRLPAVSIHRQFRVLVEDHLDSLCPNKLRLIADPGALATVGAVVREAAAERVLLAVGPEGGWNEFEKGLLAAHRFLPVGMGPRALRTDTACIALLALVHDALPR